MSFKDAFQSADAESGYSLIDTGTYEAEINDVQLDLNKTPNRLTVTYVITQEPYAGRKLFGNYQLEGRGIGFLKKDLQTLGLDYSDVGSPEDIMELIAGALNTPVVVFVNQKEWNGKTYNNVYLNDLLDAPAATAPAPLNKKEQVRREQKGAAKPPVQKAAPKQAAKAPAKKAPVKSSDDMPNFDETDEIPF